MNLSHIRDKLAANFNKSELNDLCFDLQISYENLPGDTLRDKARELVDFCYRHAKIEGLVKHCSELRPSVSWSTPSKDSFRDETNFISAFLAFVQPDILLTNNYSQILSRHYHKILVEVEKLESSEDWETLIEIKRRLREYFEYSGRYLDGVEFGKRYVNALTKLGEEEEALWAKVKHVGYLLILAGKHENGRKVIFEALDLIEQSPACSSIEELKFYAYRYLGISYQRDELSGDIKKAEFYFDKAGTVTENLNNNPRMQTELKARLLGNQGNIALQHGQFSKALDCFGLSRVMFLELGDTEHIGIAHLQIAQTIISSRRSLTEAIHHLESAEALFMRIGWSEGQGRVYHQFALLHEQLAANEEEPDQKYIRLKESLFYAKKAKTIFEQIEHQKWVGSAETVLIRVQQLSAE